MKHVAKWSLRVWNKLAKYLMVYQLGQDVFQSQPAWYTPGDVWRETQDRVGLGQGTQSLPVSLLKHKLTKLNLMLQG